MQITIAEKLKPFDHTPGTTTILPGSTFSIAVFPTLIRLYDLSSSKLDLLAEIEATIKGPVVDFTVQLDLERGVISVFGKSAGGYFRYCIKATSDGKGVFFDVERAAFPLNFIKEDKPLPIEIHGFLLDLGSLDKTPYKPAPSDRLSLGNHKLQDWTMIKRRSDLKEIMPIWLKMGQLVKVDDELLREGTACLLKTCEEAIKKGNIDEVLSPFLNLFLSGFHGIMTPRLYDTEHQGFRFSDVTSHASPLTLLTYGAKLIRSLFISSMDQTINVLPVLPTEFHAGRFRSIALKNLGIVDLEWSKKIIRRMIFISETDGFIDINWQKCIKRFRLTEGLKTEIVEVNSPIKVEKGKIYYFDRFQK